MVAAKPEDLLAFIDESKRPVRNRKTGKPDTTQWQYALAAVVIMRADLTLVRQQLQQIEADLNYKLHYHEMKSHTRRRNAIDAINSIAEWDGYIAETSKPIKPSGEKEHGARASQLKQAFVYLGIRGITQVAIETRVRPEAKHKTLDKNDLAMAKKLRDQKIIDARFHLEHVGKEETLLKIADLLASSRTDMLCARDEAIYPRIGHRVTSIK